MNIVVIGTQWGDEGKGKLIDILSEKTDITVRYQGGSNAGHTVVVGDQEYVFHLIPSAILHQNKVCVIGNGAVVDPKVLLDELEDLKKRNIIVTPKQFKISDCCHIVLPYHRVLDGLRESKRMNKIGTTGRGIGPCYADKVTRCGIRMIDLLNPKVLKSKLEDNLKEKNEIFQKVYGYNDFSFSEIYEDYLNYGKQLEKFVCNAAVYLNDAIDRKKDILFEGAQGTFLDIDFGTYPFVTSSNSTAGGACSGSGVSPTRIDRVIGAAKAYTTRVGEGPFPTEFSDQLKTEIRAKGNEFGATTGRPRRCGWFDAVLVRYSVIINDITELAIMKLDVLDDLKIIKICTAYKANGKIYKDFPNDIDVLSSAVPIYEEVPGWQASTRGVRSFAKLPAKARAYILRLENILKTKVKYISVGTKRNEIIKR
ncbi:MAG: adenylosuccinate synthase [Omnitrophica WOR_2 bacterium GWA2_47_8]|nr:MAG: adenylosuccinate synthase [Omnitrophica WOR_2 bacterium GWA2_47_8]